MTRNPGTTSDTTARWLFHALLILPGLAIGAATPGDPPDHGRPHDGKSKTSPAAIAEIDRIVSCTAGKFTGEAQIRGTADNTKTSAAMQLVRYRILGADQKADGNKANVYIGVDLFEYTNTWWYGPWKEVTADNGVQDGEWHYTDENDPRAWVNFDPYRVGIINGGVKFTFDKSGSDPTCKTTDNGWGAAR